MVSTSLSQSWPPHFFNNLKIYCSTNTSRIDDINPHKHHHLAIRAHHCISRKYEQRFNNNIHIAINITPPSSITTRHEWHSHHPSWCSKTNAQDVECDHVFVPKTKIFETISFTYLTLDSSLLVLVQISQSLALQLDCHPGWHASEWLKWCHHLGLNASELPGVAMRHGPQQIQNAVVHCCGAWFLGFRVCEDNLQARFPSLCFCCCFLSSFTPNLKCSSAQLKAFPPSSSLRLPSFASSFVCCTRNLQACYSPLCSSSRACKRVFVSHYFYNLRCSRCSSTGSSSTKMTSIYSSSSSTSNSEPCARDSSEAGEEVPLLVAACGYIRSGFQLRLHK